ncbi:MAG TPA: CHAT domain-containing protein [Thermoanaerobaculia bacterium]
MTHPSMSACPDDGTLAAWVEGRLAKSEIPALVAHASGCEKCIPLLDAANETFHAETDAAAPAAPRTWPRWFLAAAALLLLVPAYLVFRSRSDRAVEELVALAPRSGRPVEARLTGGFAWAPYRGSMRATATAADREQMKLIGAAAEALDRAERDPSADAQRAAAVALVLIERSEEGIARLTAETKRSPRDAGAWSDLAAAQYAAARSGRTSLYPEALASAERALRLDPHLAEALFNRALILEQLGLGDLARRAWQTYLDNDASSPWAGEAREHLARLSARSGPPSYDADRPRLEQAAAAGDAALVASLVGVHAERARAYAEVEYLGRWAEGLQKNDAAEAARWLTVSRNIGLALARASGESLLRDAVQAIDAADPQRQQRIADAHLVYRRGRVAFSRRDLDAGERDLREAAARFAAAGDPMALAARSYAASARLARNDVLEARRELSALLVEADAGRGYLSLAGQVRWELARCLMFDADWSAAARILGEAESLFGRAGETFNQAMITVMLAAARTAAGRPDEAWSARTRAFATLAEAGKFEQLQSAVGAAAAEALRVGKPEAARALAGIGETLAREVSNDLLLADMLVRKSLLDSTSDPESAARAAADAATVALRIPDPALRARHVADADLAMAVALLDSDASRAREFASRALDTYTANAMTALIAEPCLVRARASVRLGDREAAARDLAAGIAAVEQHPVSVGGTTIGTGVLDAGRALFEEAIRLDLDRGDVASALGHAERSRGVPAEADALRELRARLAGSGTAVVVTIVLPRELVVLAATERGASASRHSVERDAVIALAAHGSDAALYDLLIRPAAAAVAGARALIVVPDPLLEAVPYAALADAATGRPLVERMSVAIAASTTSLRAAPAAMRRETLAAIELPSGIAARTAALPELKLELAGIGRLYREVRRVRPDGITGRVIEEEGAGADVLHIAGHTETDAPSGGEALAAGAGAISWRTITAMRGMAPVVVLSACNTLRRPEDPNRRALSLAGAFVAAGARDVAGTLAPIGDRDARELFFAFHEQLARGVAAPDALRHVQLARLHRGQAWRHVALLTSTIHRTTD